MHCQCLHMSMEDSLGYIPYGTLAMAGDFVTVRIDMTNEGIL